MRLVLLLTLLLGACGSNGAHETLSRGNAAFEQFQFDEAEEHYAETIRRDPALAEPHLRRGQMRFMERRFEEALEHLDRALALEPGLAWGRFLRGSSLFSLERYDEALPELVEAGASAELPDEDRSRAHRLRAIIFMNTDRYAEGAEALTEAIALRPDNALQYFERGTLYAEMGRREEAVADLEQFLRLDTSESELATQARETLDALAAPR